ncbi:MAG: hypothetical protein LBG19_02645 [Prevotellaceae bacterium]|jgi:transposase|nr:hypothetical protein [Prevotellaceae bacterium]
MFVGYTGSKRWIYPHGESPRQVNVLAAILGCGLLTYAEAVAVQSKEDFICACENTFYYYGGVPRSIAPDSLKAAVTKAGRYESLINEEFERFAEHYGVTVIPARVRKPRDKSHVENAVKSDNKDIFTRIDSSHCPDPMSPSVAIRSAPELHNNGPMTNRKYSRRSYVEDIEKIRWDL